jgi:cyclopropane fatty-acyl-phospholipid synthase-like methyltransferase
LRIERRLGRRCVLVDRFRLRQDAVMVAEDRGLEPWRVVQRGYDEIGSAYHDWSHASPVRLRFVATVLDRLSPGSRVVDLGCGPGDPATRLLSEQHVVLGVDVSMAQLQLARRLAPRASLVAADITTFHLAPASVDAVVSFFALGHLPPRTHADLMVRIASWLRPGGLLVTSAPLTAGDDVEDGWLGVPMYFGGIGEEAMLAAVSAAGLVLESAERVGEDEGEGRIVEFLWVTATRPR